MQVLRTPLLADRVMQRIAKPILRQQNPPAFKRLAFDMGGGVEDVSEGFDDHGGCPLVVGVVGSHPTREATESAVYLSSVYRVGLLR